MVKEYGYEYDAAPDAELLERTKGKTTANEWMGARCLRSGRDALKAIAREYPPCVALLPALACDSMVRPFEQYGHRVKYYRIRDDYSIDEESLDFGGERVLFLYMDYFGRSAISDERLTKLRENRNVVFIEDRTHNLIWERKSAFRPDYVMASLRKWLPVPDGGLLWGTIGKPLASDTSFSEKRLAAQCMRREYFRIGDEAIKTEYRKIFSTVSDIMDSDEPSAMSAYAYELAKRADWDRIRAARKANAETLIPILRKSPYVTMIQKDCGVSDLYVAFTVPNRNEVQRRLSAMGVFHTVIWPLSDEQKRVCPVAARTEETMLAAPCDQRYTTDDMRTIGAETVRVIAEVNGLKSK